MQVGNVNCVGDTEIIAHVMGCDNFGYSKNNLVNWRQAGIHMTY